jgi:hypothetical protein
MEVRGNNRSVMPLDVLGRTRATLTEPASKSPWPKGLGNLVKLCRAGDRALQLLLFNEECLVSASHQLALTTSLDKVGDDLQSLVTAKGDIPSLRGPLRRRRWGRLEACQVQRLYGGGWPGPLMV